MTTGQMVETVTPIQAEAKPLKRDVTALAVAGMVLVLWASAFAGIRVGLTGYAPESLALLRYLTASAAMLIYAIVTRMPLPALRDIPLIGLMGFLGISVYNVFLNTGEVGVSAGVASFVISSETILTGVLAAWWLRDRLTRAGWLGIFIGLSGVALISMLREGSVHIDAGIILIFGAAVAKAFYTVGQKPLLRTYGAMRFTAYAIWGGTFWLLIYLPHLIEQLPTAPGNATLAVLYMGIFPGAIGYAGWSFVLSRIPASIATTFLYLVPFIATLIAWVWLGEVPGIGIIAAGALIVTGVVIVSKKGKAGR